MAEPSRAAINPQSGKVEEYDASQLARLRQTTGGRELTPQEKSAYDIQQREEREHSGLGEAYAAGVVGKVRGVGEAFGVPVDALAGAVGDAAGKGPETRAYLNELKRWHPIQTGLGEITGQVGGLVAGGEMLAGAEASRAPSVIGRMAESALTSGARGGLENLVIGSTHDINEAALGNADLSAEKLLAQAPKHFATGAIAGAIGGPLGEGASELWGALGRKAPGALEGASDRFLGREFGGGSELGAELRGALGKVPGSRAEAEAGLAARQAGVDTESAAAKDILLGRQVSAAGQQSIEQEGARVAKLKQAKEAMGELDAHHQMLRESLESKQGEAVKAATDLQAERETVQEQIKTLAGDLDKVKGAELPSRDNILRAASDAFDAQGTLTPPSPRSIKVWGEWTQSFADKYKHAPLTFSELESSIASLDSVRKRAIVAQNPDVARAFGGLRDAMRGEFDRASAATADTVSEAKSLSAAALRERLPQIETAHDAALENVAATRQAIGEFEKTAATNRALTERHAAIEQQVFEKSAKEDRADLIKGQRLEEKTLPAPDERTGELLDLVRKAPERSGSGAAPIGALVSLLQGNIAGAAIAAAGGLGAGVARAHGNLLAARTLSALSQFIAKSDGQIARLAGRAVGRYARQGVLREPVEDEGPKPRLTYERVSRSIREAQGNPLIIQQRVQSIAPWAQQAPAVYSSLVSSTMRMQAFLESKLPPSRVDPTSLTPHLEQDQLSDSEKYDFMQYVRACNDPIQSMKDVVDGRGSPAAVEAVAAVYPGIMGQARAEVEHQLMQLTKPLDYERSVNIGTLLQIDTSSVMTGNFQSMQSSMYAARASEAKGPKASKPKGANSRLSKSYASAGQQIQENSKQ